MTENELRKKVADTMSAWVGGERGGEQHREILRLYNVRKVLPRGYVLREDDAYCAAAVSAAWIKAGCDVLGLVPIECSCSQMLSLAKGGGAWVEADGHIPSIGDVVLYDWQDSGQGDNQGAPDHAGIVVRISDSGYMDIAEGNMDGGKIGSRTIRVDGQYIRGYITPDYAAIAAELTADADAERVAGAVADKMSAELEALKASLLLGFSELLRERDKPLSDTLTEAAYRLLGEAERLA